MRANPEGRPNRPEMLITLLNQEVINKPFEPDPDNSGVGTGDKLLVGCVRLTSR